MHINDYLMYKQAKKQVNDDDKMSPEELEHFKTFMATRDASNKWNAGQDAEGYFRQPSNYELANKKTIGKNIPELNHMKALALGGVAGAGLGFGASEYLNRVLGLHKAKGMLGNIARRGINILGAGGGLLAGSTVAGGINAYKNEKDWWNGNLAARDAERKAKGLPPMSKNVR